MTPTEKTERSPLEIAEEVFSTWASGKKDADRLVFLIYDAIQAERAKKREIVWPSEEECPPYLDHETEDPTLYWYISGALWMKRRVEELNP